MPLTIWSCVLSDIKKNYFRKNWPVLPRNYFKNRNSNGSNFLLPSFLTFFFIFSCEKLLQCKSFSTKISML